MTFQLPGTMERPGRSGQDGERERETDDSAGSVDEFSLPARNAGCMIGAIASQESRRRRRSARSVAPANRVFIKISQRSECHVTADPRVMAFHSPDVRHDRARDILASIGSHPDTRSASGKNSQQEAAAKPRRCLPLGHSDHRSISTRIPGIADGFGKQEKIILTSPIPSSS